MSASVLEKPATAAPPRRALAVTLLAVALVLACIASIFLGSQRLSPLEVWEGLLGTDPQSALIVRDMRIPRTVIALGVGAALGIAGALIQGFSRNPLADPGILGVNAGAGAGIVAGVAFAGASGALEYIWFAFTGAALATLLVFVIGSAGRGGADPLRMTLAGVALGAVLAGITGGISLLRPQVFNEMRTWAAGSLQALTSDVNTVLPFIVVGLAIAFALGPSMNALALGDDLATALGSHVMRTRILSIVAVTLLCGAATAAAGPIGFIGLMVPHAVRWLVGPHQVWILVGTVLGAPLLLIVSDIVARLILPTGELSVGLVTAFIGAPVLIALVRRRKASGL
ncbi:iron chelate uptake ABC transporter family permease subunit [Microbacterium allomyrinae]|uniref:Iron chelate uptake ABC transporter family permease subunit n=1 Tax=Microbacterium allomyrinae TaxID=2830666 RepID=A0A9X1LSG7_9MICO|nr:iron chelate uptake ABC transporter family permease subunit [Microbacterium allomyrinae]MCC2030918.1 iron chelate uptake ABC transporter family permease subunit [Microbacterium allomyrinae]